MLPIDIIGLGLFFLGSIPVLLYPRWKHVATGGRSKALVYGLVVLAGLIGYGGWVIYWIGLLQLATLYFSVQADLLMTIILASVISILTYNLLLDRFGKWLDHLLGKPGQA